MIQHLALYYNEPGALHGLLAELDRGHGLEHQQELCVVVCLDICLLYNYVWLLHFFAIVDLS